MLVFVAGVMIHVLPSRHPARVNAVEGHRDLPDSAGEECVAAIQFPTVDAPIQDLLLEALPPAHGFGTAVIDEAAFALPPTPRVAVACQVSLGARLLVELRRLLYPGVLAVTV